jgi:hypothetical protein
MSLLKASWSYYLILNITIGFSSSLFPVSIPLLFLGCPLTVRPFAKPWILERNASVKPNATENRNLSSGSKKPGFAQALLAFRWL